MPHSVPSKALSTWFQLSWLQLSWFQRKPEKAAILFLASFAVLLRLLIIGHPTSAVFDEVHFNYFAGFYYTGQYYYDIHPPLGKLLIALAALPFGGIAPEDVVRTISTPYPSDTYMAMRVLPALFGSMLPVLIFCIARQLNISFRSSVLAGVFVMLDNAFIIQSRLILLDSMLLGFGFLSLYTFLKARENNKLWLWLLSAFFAGCSVSIKWIGVSFIGLIGLVILVDWGKSLIKGHFSLRPFYKGSAYLATAILTYLSTFAIHFALLPISHQQGDQFMTPEFRSTLEGSEYFGAKGTVQQINCPPNYKHTLRYAMPDTAVSPAQKIACKIEFKPLSAPGFFAKIIELNRTMYATNQGLASSHPDASKWYTWPLMHKPLYYWHKDGARIYLMGNPVVWWLSGLAVLILMFGQFYFKQWRQNEAFWILATGFWANILPFMLVSRVMFMYHYLTTLCFAILISAFVIGRIKTPPNFHLILSLLTVLGFLLISPITYGINWYGSDLLWFLRVFGWHP